MWQCGCHWASNDSCMWRHSCHWALKQAQNTFTVYETWHICHSDKVHCYVTYWHSNNVTKSTVRCTVSGCGSEQRKDWHKARLCTECTLCGTAYCSCVSCTDDNGDKMQSFPGSGCSCAGVVFRNTHQFLPGLPSESVSHEWHSLQRGSALPRTESTHQSAK